MSEPDRPEPSKSWTLPALAIQIAGCLAIIIGLWKTRHGGDTMLLHAGFVAYGAGSMMLTTSRFIQGALFTPTLIYATILCYQLSQLV